MKVHFFERKTIEPFISIEKLFSILKKNLVELGVEVKTFKNPYPIKNMLKAMWYFNKNQGKINHITGDIHWVALVLDPKKTILTIHDLAGLQYLTGIRKKVYYYLWVYLPIKRLKYITVISKKTKDEIVELLPWASEKIVVIPNCLTIEFPDNFEKVKNKIPKILIIGTLQSKNISRSIEALKKIKCELIIVGKIDKKDEDLLRKYNINHINHFNISERMLIEIYKESDILLFPSLYEGFGLPILEAQAYKCAVITSNMLPMSEVSGEGAVLVNPFSIEEIENAVNKLSNNMLFRDEIIKKGLENVKKYTPSNITKQYYELYKRI